MVNQLGIPISDGRRPNQNPHHSSRRRISCRHQRIDCALQGPLELAGRVLDKARPLQRLSPAYVRRNIASKFWTARDKLIAFFAVVVSDNRVVLDNLTRALIGIGRRACEHVFR
jgi:hypothetical protein